MKQIKPIEISPEEFEQQIKSWLSKAHNNLVSFKITHRKYLEGRSGEYEIDIVAEFEIFESSQIVVLIECKRYKNPVKRDIIMVLNQKLQEIGAHKGMVFSTSGFQSGAISFASEHKIATITVQDGKTNYHTKSHGGRNVFPPWVHISKFIGWYTNIGSNGLENYSLINDSRIEPLATWIEDLEEAK